MKISSRLKGGTYEVSFGYHSKLDGYASLMSDMPTLCDMTSDREDIGKYLYNKKDIYTSV